MPHLGQTPPFIWTRRAANGSPGIAAELQELVTRFVV